MNIYLDHQLTEEEKEIKKIKKLLGNNKAFFNYKKRGSLVRDQDYLSIPRKIKQKLHLDDIKKDTSRMNRRRRTIDVQPEHQTLNHKLAKNLEKNGDLNHSVNLHFEK